MGSNYYTPVPATLTLWGRKRDIQHPDSLKIETHQFGGELNIAVERQMQMQNELNITATCGADDICCSTWLHFCLYKPRLFLYRSSAKIKPNPSNPGATQIRNREIYATPLSAENGCPSHLESIPGVVRDARGIGSTLALANVCVRYERNLSFGYRLARESMAMSSAGRTSTLQRCHRAPSQKVGTQLRRNGRYDRFHLHNGSSIQAAQEDRAHGGRAEGRLGRRPLDAPHGFHRRRLPGLQPPSSSTDGVDITRASGTNTGSAARVCGKGVKHWPKTTKGRMQDCWSRDKLTLVCAEDIAQVALVFPYFALAGEKRCPQASRSRCRLQEELRRILGAVQISAHSSCSESYVPSHPYYSRLNRIAFIPSTTILMLFTFIVLPLRPAHRRALRRVCAADFLDSDFADIDVWQLRRLAPSKRTTTVKQFSFMDARASNQARSSSPLPPPLSRQVVSAMSNAPAGTSATIPAFQELHYT
ncbi:hypothetical protein C8R44DRAFT_752859 [Mycena epipterygia]|nr:hypothetical protein C8R44DRAFT_752859 [Mycena epipterygia]